MQDSNVSRLLKAGFWFVVILCIFVAALTVNAFKENRFIGGGVPESTTITVSGEGEVFAVPDVAEFTFTIEERADTVAAAQEQAAQKENAILAFLEGEGIEESDIKTVEYNAYPEYEWRQETITCVRFPCPEPPGERVLTGYVARQTIQVTVHETERAGELLSGVGSQGVSYVSGLNFTIDDEEAIRQEARQNAIANAREKAKQLADDLDVHLVRIVGFSDGGYPVPYYGRASFDSAAEQGAVPPQPTPDLPTGENRIVSNVTIIYEIR